MGSWGSGEESFLEDSSVEEDPVDEDCPAETDGFGSEEGGDETSCFVQPIRQQSKTKARNKLTVLFTQTPPFKTFLNLSVFANEKYSC